jgi:hypothetical protein
MFMVLLLVWIVVDQLGFAGVCNVAAVAGRRCGGALSERHAIKIEHKSFVCKLVFEI